MLLKILTNQIPEKPYDIIRGEIHILINNVEAALLLYIAKLLLTTINH